MRIFFDSSAVVKRYIDEPGSQRVLFHSRQAAEVILSILCPLEVISALTRRWKEGAYNDLLYHKLKRSLAADIDQALIIPVDSAVVRRTVQCLEKTSLRTLDAIHVASAKVSNCDLFLTADKQQMKAASLFGLTSELVIK